MPGTVYDRMESQIRGRSFKPLRQRLVEGALIVAMIFLLGYLLYAAQFSGTVRWFLGFAVISVIAGYAWLFLARRTSEPAPLLKPAERPRIRTGELRVLTSVVRRASQDLLYSQVAVSTRARDAFTERTRLARGLSPEAMRRLGRDMAALRETYHDDVLEDFVYLRSSDTEERYRWVRAARDGDGFDVAFHKVLDRMEEWR
ncbi:MAG TPA: hypothetical protein HA326_02160 [Thermoplasmata archaeon]|nr:hypothetical protein [Thermoplasmata archaeon]